MVAERVSDGIGEWLPLTVDGESVVPGFSTEEVLDRLVVDLRAREVDRHVDQHRARPPRSRDAEGFGEDARNVCRLPDQEAVLHDGQREAEELLDLLCERLTSDVDGSTHAENINALVQARRRCGVVLDRWWWSTVAYGWFGGRLAAEGVDFVIEPTVRFAGGPGEQATMFFLDPSGNAIEIKAMRDPRALFRAD